MMTKSIIVLIVFTKNNLIFSLLDFKKQVLNWTSIRKQRIKGIKKLNFVTATLLSNLFIKQIKSFGYLFVHLKIRGSNKTKRIVIRTFKKSFLKIFTLHDVTLQPYNGCRLKKIRRL